MIKLRKSFNWASKLPSRPILTPPSSSTEATGDLHLLRWSLSEGREEEAAAAEEEEEVEKGMQKARLLLFLERKSEVLEKRVAWASEMAIIFFFFFYRKERLSLRWEWASYLRLNPLHFFSGFYFDKWHLASKWSNG